MAPRYREAKRKAAELLSLAKVKSAPVKVDKLAKILNATIHYEKLDDEISGMVTRTGNGTAVIGVNTFHPPVRQRFTIAHEIGHLVLHEELLHIDRKFPIALRDTTASLGTDSNEIEANQFAAELLMPSALLEADVQALMAKGVDPDDAVTKLALKYDVSSQAMAIRLTNLGFLS